MASDHNFTGFLFMISNNIPIQLVIKQVRVRSGNLMKGCCMPDGIPDHESCYTGKTHRFAQNMLSLPPGRQPPTRGVSLRTLLNFPKM